MSFTKSKKVLCDLQRSLQCGKCHQNSKELLYLGNCDHWFCRSCAEDHAGYPCPLCGLPSAASTSHIDLQLSSVASLCSYMIDLIEGNNASFDNNVKVSVATPKDSPRGKQKCKDSKPLGKASKSELLDGVGNVQTDCMKPTSLESGTERDGFGNMKSLKDGKKKAKSIKYTEFTELTAHGSRKRRSASLTPSSGVDKRNISKANSNSKVTPVSTKSHVDRASTISLTADSARQTPKSVKKRRSMGSDKTSLCKRNAKGETALQVATIKMDIDEVRRLLDAGANPNVKDNAGWTPLHEAVGRGKEDIAALLISHGASVDAPGLDNETPLHDAVINQHVECVRLLLDNGANMYCRNAHGHSSLDLAHNEDITTLLLDASKAFSASSMDLPLLDESSKPLCFTGSNLSKEQNKKLIQYSKVLHAKFVQDFSPEVTHLITSANEDKSCSRTLKYLQSILAGKWIVSLQWLEECNRANSRLPEHDFQMSGCISHPKSDAPKRALQNRLKQLPPLFDGCQVFFYGRFDHSSLGKEELASLVRQGGGVVLKREPHLHNLDDYPYTHPYHAQNSSSLADCTIYIIYDDICPNPPYVEAQRMSCLPVSWFLDSIAIFSFLDKANYLK